MPYDEEERKPKIFNLVERDTTDLTKLTQLLACVRYVYKENVKEELLFCCLLKDHTGRKDIYCKVNKFLKTEGLEWKNCRGLCTDGAKAMTGKNNGFKLFMII